MSKERKILFVMPRLPFPATSGRKTSLYHYCKILSQELGYYLIVAAFLEKGDNPEDKPDFIDELVILPKPSGKMKLKNILIDSFIKRDKPLQVSLYWNPKAKEIVDNVIKKHSPQIVIGDMIRSTEYIKDVPSYRIADLDDRISLRYKRQMEADMSAINPYGAFINTLSPVVRKMLLLRFVKNFVVKTEVRLVEKYEIEIGQICDCTIFVAQQEADNFNKQIKQNKAIAVPIGVDVGFFSYRKKEIKENYIGFLGAMSVAHNENAIKHFILDILPQVVKKIPDVKVMVIGGGVSNDLKKFESKNIHFTGRVDDVREYLEKCKVFVCPMTFGSGIKTKNLEAMAMGIPVVTTTIGAENINAKQNRDWIVVDDNTEFAKAIIKLLSDETMRLKMGWNGSSFINKNFTWNMAKKCFEDKLSVVNCK